VVTEEDDVIVTPPATKPPTKTNEQPSLSQQQTGFTAVLGRDHASVELPVVFSPRLQPSKFIAFEQLSANRRKTFSTSSTPAATAGQHACRRCGKFFPSDEALTIHVSLDNCKVGVARQQVNKPLRKP
jgi:hypothetical protein